MNTAHTRDTSEPGRLPACRRLGLRLWPWVAGSGIIETCVLLAPRLPEFLRSLLDALSAGTPGHG